MGRVPGRVTSWATAAAVAVLTLVVASVSVETAPTRGAPARTASARTNDTSTTVAPPTTTTTTTTTSTTSAAPMGRVFDVPFAPVLIGHLSATRTCQASDLTATAAGTNGATGHKVTYVELTNVSSIPCRLEGYPRVVAHVPDGAPVVATDGGGFFTSMAVDPAVVGPGMSLTLSLGTERDCRLRYANPAVYPTLPTDGVSIGVPGGWLFLAEDDDVLCGMTVSPYIQPPPLGPPPDSPPAFALQPVIDAPARVAAGAEFEFGVVLHNLSARAVTLSPCPWFTEGIGSGPDTDLSYLLNCAAAPNVLAPGDSLALTMELAAPPQRGVSVLNWAWGAPYQEGDNVMEAPTEPQAAVTLVVT